MDLTLGNRGHRFRADISTDNAPVTEFTKNLPLDNFKELKLFIDPWLPEINH